MNQTKRELQKSLKGPDQFQTTVVGGLESVAKYKAQIVGAIVLVVAVAIGLAFWAYRQKQATVARIDAMGEIEKIYQEELDAVAEKRKKLREQVSDFTMPGDDGQIPTLTAADKKKQADLQKQIAVVKADHSKSFGPFKDFYKSHSLFPEGWMAGIRAVSILVEQKQFEEAKDLLAEIISNSKSSMFYQVHGRVLYVNILDELAEYDEAIKQVDILLAEGNDDMRPRSLLTKGRILVHKGDREQAKKVFEELATKHEKSDEARQAQSLSALLLN